MPSSGKRHPLLVYGQLYRAWRAPALLIAIACGLLRWFLPPPLNSVLVESSLLGAGVLALLLFLYCLVGPRLSYVQCRPNHLRINTPLYRVVVSYNRIRTARPVEFSADMVRESRQWLARPFTGRTAVALDLYGYPVSFRWLRLWLNEFVLPGTFKGMLLLTPDWLALSRELENYRGQWKERVRAAGKAAGLTSLTSTRR
jgi:hypothetical protein